MKNEILERAMFAMPLSKDARNSGIMAGFEEDMPEDVEEESMEEMPPMARTPQNPEILMNTLRGDMRSMDARYQELAQMVGEDAAMETPPEVLAMLQPQLAAPQAGIGGLPQAQGMMPPNMGMPPGAQAPGGMMPALAPQGGAPMMPDPMMQGPMGAPAQPVEGIGALPQAQAMMPPGVSPPAPQQLARGGVVQNFQSGTGPEGVKPADDEGDDSASTNYFSPEFAKTLLPVAQGRMAELVRQRPVDIAALQKTLNAGIPNLQTTMNARVPMYQQMLGAKDNDYRQSQLLLDIAQRGLGFAANVDEQGRPLQGSFASRFAGAARTLPGTIMALSAEKSKEDMAIKQLALGQAEKEVAAAKSQAEKLVDLTKGQNDKLVESQRKLFGDILKAAGKGTGADLFGKGAWEWKTVNTPGLMDRYSKMETSVDEDGLIESAYIKLTRPQIESYNDPFTGNRVEKKIPGFQIPFVEEAMRQRKALMEGSASVVPVGGPGKTTPAAGASTSGAPIPASVTPTLPAPAAGSPTRDTVFGAAQAAVGPVPAFKDFVSRLPIVGGESETTRVRAFTSKTMNDLISTLQNSPRFAETERQQIAEEMRNPLNFIDNPGGFRSSIIGLDETLLRRQLSSEKIVADQNVPVDRRKKEEDKALEIKRIRDSLGVPIRVYTRKDIEALAPGTPFLWEGKTLAIRNQDKK